MTIEQHLSQDPKLAPLVADFKLSSLTDDITDDIFIDLIYAIVSQQLSTKVATIIFDRLLMLFDGAIVTPQHLLDLDEDLLRGVGLSRPKINYLKNIATYWIENDMNKYDWDNATDENIFESLTQIKGVGLWTVQMLLMFKLGRPDILPLLDLGVQQGIMRLYDTENWDEMRPKERLRRMTEIAEKWRPYRSYACRYLWKWRDSTKK